MIKYLTSNVVNTVPVQICSAISGNSFTQISKIYCGKKLSTKNVLGDILQLEWHQWICLPKPNSLPSKISLNHIQPLERNPTNKQVNGSTTTKKNGTWQMDVIMTVQSLCGRAPSVGVTWPQWEYFLLWQMLLDLQILHRHVLLHVLWQAALCLRRIMHWARRIEQEIDRVFQHITGAQQLKGVSASLCFEEILLMSALDQPIKTHTGQKAPPAEHLHSHEVEELR